MVQKLIDTADRKGSSGHDPRYGYGVIAPAKALADRAAPPPPPSSPRPAAIRRPPRTPRPKTEGDESALVTIGVVAGVLVVLAILAVVLISRRRPPDNSHHG
ncbi:hypothetical protein ACFQ10_25900 [Streptomyces indonesiensis]